MWNAARTNRRLVAGRLRRPSPRALCCAFITVGLVGHPPPELAAQSRNDVVEAHLLAIEMLGQDDEALEQLRDERLHPDVLARPDLDELLQRVATASAQGDGDQLSPGRRLVRPGRGSGALYPRRRITDGAAAVG